MWSKKIIDKFNPNLIIVEPVPEFIYELKRNFTGYQKVNIEGINYKYDFVWESWVNKNI